MGGVPMDDFIRQAVTNAQGDMVEYAYPKDRYTDPNRSDGRRSVNGKKKGWQVAEMWDKHHEIARRLILGEKNVDIAAALGCTEVQVSNVKNSPVVQDKLAIMRAARDAGTIDLAREIQDLAPIALARIREALEEGKTLGRELSGSSILKEANSVLDREIGKPTQTINTRNLHGHFTAEDLERIKNRAKELAPMNFPGGELYEK
jgi:hypothetical protein